MCVLGVQGKWWQMWRKSKMFNPSADKQQQLYYRDVMRANTLMQRRKMNLGQLKSTIQELSILQKEKPPLPTHLFLKNHSKSHNLTQGQAEDLLRSQMEDPQAVVEGSKKKLTCNPEENLKTFEETFETHEILGEGAHGVVKKCVHRVTGQVLAVKILKMEDQHFHYLKTNFINIRQLKHDSIIEYKALFLNSKQRRCHLVMEYLPYPHLTKGLKEDDLKSVFYKLLQALEYIHKNSICHRDIKPGNILYDHHSHLFKIIDFGVSKNMKLRGRYEQMLTKAGTLYYKAPEMFDGGGYTEKVDSWAVGVTLYEMVVGATPFASEYHGETIDNILHREPDFEREQFRSLQPIVKDLIARLLKKNPKDRMGCEQAKKHLWFNSNLQEIDTLRSARFQICSTTDKDEEPDFRLNSVVKADSKKVELTEVTKTDKKVMKKYLEIMSKKSTTIQEELAIDFVESEEEEEQEDIRLMSKKSTLKTLDSQMHPVKEQCLEEQMQVRQVSVAGGLGKSEKAS